MFHDDNKDKIPRRPQFNYYLISIGVILLLNWFVFPALFRPTVHPTTYTDLIESVERGEVVRAEVDESGRSIIFMEGTEEEPVYYSTGFNPDDQVLLEDMKGQGVVLDYKIPTEPNYLMSLLLSWGIPLLLLFVVLPRFFQRMQGRMGGGGVGGLSFGDSKAKVYVPDGDKKTFADVAGEDEAEESLMEIVDYLKSSDKYTKVGAKLPKGVLLVGPPGTGKTLLAKAVAGEADVPFFIISGSEFVEMFVGRGAARVRDLFKQAKEKAPCIVFIDEIDAIGKSRNSNTGNDEREQTLNQLLTEMDGFEGNTGVVILAATNRPEVLDQALLRPGRFDRQIPVNLPDLKGREEIFKVHAKDYQLSDDIDFDRIARATAGASGAQIANILNEAALRTVRMGKSLVRHEDLEEALETVIAGAQKKNDILSPEEKKIVTYHENGHALVAALQTNSAPVEKITIVPRTSGALGYTMQVEQKEKSLLSRTEAENKIATFCGGRAAEALVFGDITTGASNDIEQATKIARAMVTKYGMSDNFGMMGLETTTGEYLGGQSSLTVSEKTASIIDEEVRIIIERQYEKAYKLLEDNLPLLHKLSEFLYKEETITGDQFMEFFEKYRDEDEIAASVAVNQ